MHAAELGYGAMLLPPVRRFTQHRTEGVREEAMRHEASRWRPRAALYVAGFNVLLAALIGAGARSLWASIGVLALLAVSISLGVLLADRVVGAQRPALLRPAHRRLLVRGVLAALALCAAIAVVAAALDSVVLLGVGAIPPIAAGAMSLVLLGESHTDNSC